MVSAITVALALASPAAAQDGSEPRPSVDQELGAVRELVMYANYRAALPAVRALLGRTDLTAQQRNAGLEVLATVDLALRDERGAREALAQLYARDPGHRLTDPDASPVVQSAFARAREGARAVSVTIEHAPPVLERRVAPEIDARIGEGVDAVHDIQVAYRERGETRWTHVQLGLEGGAANGRLPITRDDDAAFTIEYYLEARAPSSTVLASVGSPEAPLSIEVPAAPVVVAAPIEEAPVPVPTGGGDVTGEAWFWVVIGVLVAGAGVGIGVGVVLGGQGPENGSLGNVTLPLGVF